MSDIAASLIDWYDRHHRVLPWRISPRDRASGVKADPYRIWLSEIMLQQTTVAAVGPYFHAFVERWPTVGDLAAAEDDDVMRAWAGLGYYSRARNLLKAARAVAALPEGSFPDSEEALRALPGIGAYTSAAVAAIAFDRPSAVVDGNVERVVTRLRRIETPVAEAKPLIRAHVAEMVPADRPGDFAQAMMDLGATICTPRRPKCILCPIREACLAFRDGDPERYPVKAAKKAKPVRHGTAFVAVRADGAVLLRRREDRGLLGGMAETPSGGWDGSVAAPPFDADWQLAGSISHTFTHFQLQMEVRVAQADGPAPAGSWWSPADEIANEALPTVMKKVLEAAIPGITKRRPARP
jgi:A/G-specific adenine glycosylase